MSTAKRPARAAVVKDAPMRPGPKGGMLRIGNPGSCAGGRPPDEFKAMCRALASRDATREKVEVILRDPDHPMFMRALQWASDQGYGKAAESVEVTHGGKLTVAFVHESTRGRGG